MSLIIVAGQTIIYSCSTELKLGSTKATTLWLTEKEDDEVEDDQAHALVEWVGHESAEVCPLVSLTSDPRGVKQRDVSVSSIGDHTKIGLDFGFE